MEIQSAILLQNVNYMMLYHISIVYEKIVFELKKIYFMSFLVIGLWVEKLNIH